MNDPIGDSVRSILDGHIVLSRDLAVRNHYPAIEVTHSISRLMTDIVGPEHREAASRLKETLSIYNDAKDLIDLGAYTSGSNPRIDYAIEHINGINEYLRQQIEEAADFETTVSALINLFPTGMPRRDTKTPSTMPSSTRWRQWYRHPTTLSTSTSFARPWRSSFATCPRSFGVKSGTRSRSTRPTGRTGRRLRIPMQPRSSAAGRPRTWKCSS